MMTMVFSNKHFLLNKGNSRPSELVIILHQDGFEALAEAMAQEAFAPGGLETLLAARWEWFQI